MTDDKRPPCFDRLDAECFEKEPEWAKQAFAYRLLRLLLPEPITKRLPTSLREALVAPGVIIPPGVELPPGAVFPPGSVIPPGRTPTDPLPLGVLPPPVLPAAAAETGPAPPTYMSPGTPGPAHPPGGSPPTVCPATAFSELFTTVTPHRISADRIHTDFTADVGTWSCYLDRGISGTNHLQVIAGYLALYQSTAVNYQYVYIGDSDVFNIRCATQIRAQNKRRTSGGETALRLYNGRPPDGTIILSEPMRTSGSYGFTYLDLSAGIKQYTDLYICLYVGGGHWQEVTRVDME